MAKESTSPQNPVNPVEKNTVQFANDPYTGSNWLSFMDSNSVLVVSHPLYRALNS